MDTNWIIDLKSELENSYIHQPEAEWIDLTISSNGFIDLTIVSNHFRGLSYQSRRDGVQRLVQRTTGFLSLYTVEEAKTLEMERPVKAQSHEVRTWHDLAIWAQNPQNHEPIIKEDPHSPRTVAFYSFKGGVGRTTALTHVAWLLAKRGKKVVVVDLDLEAPGLSAAFNLPDPPSLGITDYFYERAYAPDDAEFEIVIGDILREVPVEETSGQLLVVSAGKVNLSYFAKVDDLKATAWVNGQESLWDTFTKDINKQVKPDLLLIDSRTGINQWGAFSLIQSADESVIFLFPNAQNSDGIEILVQSLSSLGKSNINFVFSPIPDLNQSTLDRVNELNKNLNNLIPLQELPPDIKQDELGDIDEKSLYIPYLPAIARAESYPVVELTGYYQEIANRIDRDGFQATSRSSEDRWTLIDNFTFPSSFDAGQGNSNIENIFQKTANFDRFLDDSTCLIQGKKGTGKTAIYRLFIDKNLHEKLLYTLPNDRLKNITFISGYGDVPKYGDSPSLVRPDRDQLFSIHTKLIELNASWSSFWRAYTLMRIYHQHENVLEWSRSKELKPLRDLIRQIPKQGFGSKHIQALVQIAGSDLKDLAIDAFTHLNEKLSSKDAKLWLLYDDLDEDFSNRGDLQHTALTGLFEFFQACDAKDLTHIRLKIFLRQDIWESLTFENKSHVNGRYMVLEWKHVDFLRLAYRLITQSSQIRTYLDKRKSVPDPDQANENLLEEALKPIWGHRLRAGSRGKQVYRWIYDRLTDTSGTSFPRSLIVLLNAAKAKELEYKDNPSIPAPEDRLLRSAALVEGLREASKERCSAIRTEIVTQYPSLEGFFDALQNCSSLMTDDEIKQLWKKNGQDVISDFEKFKKYLVKLGLMEWKERDKKYRFADIYVYGFGMDRRGVP